METVIKPTPHAPLKDTAMASGKRLIFIDNLRWVMIVLVVLIHLNVTYSTIGRWYYVERRPVDTFSTILFGIYGSFTQAFFMGFLFFIAGYFVPSSYDKKGAFCFSSDRLVRLGVPTLVYMLILDPLTNLISMAFNHTMPSNIGAAYLQYLTSFGFIGSSGPLWFAFALLIFSVIYAAVRWVFNGKDTRQTPNPTPITHRRVFGIIAAIALATYITRLFQPIGTAFFNMQLCYFPQYIVLFLLGLAASRRNGLINIPYAFGMTWMRLAIGVGFPLWSAIMLGGGALHDMTPYYGGIHWQAVAYALWESFFCIGFCLGLLVLFREKYNIRGKLSGFMSENAFGVYVFHAPILVAFTLWLQPVVLHPLLKMIGAAVIVLPACFGFSHYFRKIPGMAKIFS